MWPGSPDSWRRLRTGIVSSGEEVYQYRGPGRASGWNIFRRKRPQLQAKGVCGEKMFGGGGFVSDRQSGLVSDRHQHRDRFDWDNCMMPRTLISNRRLKVLEREAAQTSHLMGDMAEFGVFEGGSAARIAAACPKKVHLFDTFCGMPYSDSLSSGKHRTGDFMVSFEAVKLGLAGYPCEGEGRQSG